MDRRSFLKNLGLAAASVPVLARGKLILPEDKEIIVPPEKDALLMRVDTAYKVTPVMGDVVRTSELTMSAFSMTEVSDVDTTVNPVFVAKMRRKEFEITTIDLWHIDLLSAGPFTLIVDHIQGMNPFTCNVAVVSHNIEMMAEWPMIQKVSLVEVACPSTYAY